ncbi:hypothetical protein [Streptomyces sp. NPDC020742]|uniref:hypothetical protein n=1 Tax=Streptomyces sp. NPDC020742 TaxID=3154897 RepID=UPI0033FE95A2
MAAPFASCACGRWRAARAAVRPWLASLARTWTQHLARLHATGWVHADVQLTNALVTHDGHAAVIAYALAYGPGDGRRAPPGSPHPHHRPEFATAVLSPRRHPHPRQPPADIWSLVPPCSGAGPATARPL